MTLFPLPLFYRSSRNEKIVFFTSRWTAEIKGGLSSTLPPLKAQPAVQTPAADRRTECGNHTLGVRTLDSGQRRASRLSDENAEHAKTPEAPNPCLHWFKYSRSQVPFQIHSLCSLTRLPQRSCTSSRASLQSNQQYFLASLAHRRVRFHKNVYEGAACGWCCWEVKMPQHPQLRCNYETHFLLRSVHRIFNGMCFIFTLQLKNHCLHRNTLILWANLFCDDTNSNWHL